MLADVNMTEKNGCCGLPQLSKCLSMGGGTEKTMAQAKDSGVLTPLKAIKRTLNPLDGANGRSGGGGDLIGNCHLQSRK